MAKPNYSFEKRQRDLAKKAKKEEKRLRKAGGPANPEGTENSEPTAPPPATEPKTPDCTTPRRVSGPAGKPPGCRGNSTLP